jgi:regulator of sirC expression with transglutaminase-like and TPR domain
LKKLISNPVVIILQGKEIRFQVCGKKGPVVFPGQIIIRMEWGHSKILILRTTWSEKLRFT